MAIAPRFLSRVADSPTQPVGEAWGDTVIAIPEGAPECWHNAIDDQHLTARGAIEAARAFRAFPAALLIAGRADGS